MQWACLLLPQIALDDLLRRAEDPDAPVVLVHGPRQRRCLHSVNPAARALGLRPGMTLATAHALGGGFRTAEFDPSAAERCRQWLAAWAYGYSSQVSLDFAHAVVLEVSRSRSLFGPWPRLEARLRDELRAQGFRHRIVVAPNAHAARVLANVHDGLAVADDALRAALDGVPVERAGIDAQATQAFLRMGLTRLGQLFALPRATLSRRFPPAVSQHLDRLCGEHAPLRLYRPPDRFEARIEFEYDVESSTALMFPLRRLTSDLATFLASRDGGVQRFSLWLEHERRADSEVVVGLLAPEREAGMLFELARGRLEQARPPAPVRALRLDARELPPFVPAACDLFDSRARQQLPWMQLRERLRARLGDDAVHALGWQADHRPDCVPHGAPVVPPHVPGGARPGWLVPEPGPVPEPVRRVVAGPERIESGWWDGDDVRRDYYVVETAKGRRAWVYRPLRRIDDPVPPFVLHGWFG